MYSENEIEAAVASGAIDRDAAERLRASVAAQRDTMPADEEMFRLVTGFNDIFVTIAASLVVFATGTLLGGLGVALVSWALAEQFTRRKRMALPSIFLLLCYAGGIFGFLVKMLTAGLMGRATYEPGADGLVWFVGIAAAGCLTAAAVGLHWRRFHVPITIAAGALSVAVVAAALFGVILSVIGVDGRTVMPLLQWFAFAIGVAMFAYAMHWDLQDPQRVTRRSDVAFWLHLTASPLIVHPMFLQIAKLGAVQGGETVAAVLALMLYAALGALALIVDRRAVLVSALFYVVVAIGVIVKTDGQVGNSIAVSGLVIGGLLLAMSVFWRDLRAMLLSRIPAYMRIRLPDAPAHGQAPRSASIHD
jgi:hypothetical protein